MDHDDVGSAPLLAGNAKLAFYLAVILFFAVALRIFCFTGMSGSDDIDYNREAHYVSIGEFESRLLDRSRSPSLYINTLRVGLNFPVALFFRLGGVNEITSILVPFLCSLGLISLSFLGGRLFFDTNTGLMAALLMSLLPIDVRHATKLIPDSPGAFWAGLLPVLFSSQQDHDTQRLYRLYDFSKSQIIHPDGFCCVAGKVNSADKLYLVIESVKRDTQHQLDSNALAPAERAGGRPL